MLLPKIIPRKVLFWFSSLFLLLAFVRFITYSYSQVSNSSFAYETEFKAYLDATFAINTENKEVIYFVMPLTSCTYCIQKSYEALTLMSPKDNMFIIIVGDFKNANVDQLAFTKLPFKKLHDVNEAAYRYGFGLAKPMVIHMRNNRCVLGQEISDDMIEEIPEIFQITPKKTGERKLLKNMFINTQNTQVMAHYPVIPERFLQGVKTRKQLAGEYDMSESTFYRHLKKHHLHLRLPNGLLRPADYIIVYQTLVPPVLPPVSMKPPATHQADRQARVRFCQVFFFEIDVTLQLRFFIH